MPTAKHRKPSFALIGALPDTQHGENACRERLAKLLAAKGCEVKLVYKWTAEALKCRSQEVIFFPGQSLKASILELPLLWIWTLKGKRVFLWFHNRSARRFRDLLAGFLPKNAHYLVLNQALAEGWREGFTVEVLANGVPDIEADQIRPTEQLKCKRLVWLSRVSEEKGFLSALETFRLLRRDDKDWKMDIYGPKADCAIPEIEGLTYHGSISGEVAKAAAFALGGIFILPSQYRNETQPLVMIEAMRSGLPLVVSKVNGIDSMLVASNGARCGEAVPPKDAIALVTAIQRVYDAYVDYAIIARRVYEEQYNEAVFEANVRRIFSPERPRHQG